MWNGGGRPWLLLMGGAATNVSPQLLQGSRVLVNDNRLRPSRKQGGADAGINARKLS